jgi:cell wall-associated NlpC family hydrolase
LKKILLLFILFILATSCKTSSSTTSSNNKLAEKIIDDATNKIGSPYRFGGTTNAGYDCSGLVFTSFKKYDLSLPRTSKEMAKEGKIISKSNAQKGDLIFFKTGGSSQINHVGLIVDVNRDDIKFVHSSTKKGVIISSITEDYYQKSFVQINRILE